MGVVRRLPVAKSLVYDYIPVDKVVNTMILGAIYVSSNRWFIVLLMYSWVFNIKCIFYKVNLKKTLKQKSLLDLYLLCNFILLHRFSFFNCFNYLSLKVLISKSVITFCFNHIWSLWHLRRRCVWFRLLLKI